MYAGLNKLNQSCLLLSIESTTPRLSLVVIKLELFSCFFFKILSQKLEHGLYAGLLCSEFYIIDLFMN